MTPYLLWGTQMDNLRAVNWETELLYSITYPRLSFSSVDLLEIHNNNLMSEWSSLQTQELYPFFLESKRVFIKNLVGRIASTKYPLVLLMFPVIRS